MLSKRNPSQIKLKITNVPLNWPNWLNEECFPIVNLIQAHSHMSITQFLSGISVVHPMHVPRLKSFLSIISLKQHIIIFNLTDYAPTWCITLIHCILSKVYIMQKHYILIIADNYQIYIHCSVHSWLYHMRR